MNYSIETIQPSPGYALLDSGDGEKLERYGNVIICRPDPQALWKKSQPERWRSAQAIFTREGKNGSWKFTSKLPERWEIEFANLKFWIRPTSFKHTGLFPEQASNWDWMRGLIRQRSTVNSQQSSEPKSDSRSSISVLNLFGYTGGASIACAQAGAEVCHVDGSKVAIGWGRDNAKISGLAEKPIRWILDDAAAFVRREIKRGKKYDGILLDPPAFGHGPTGEMWKIEDDFVPFIEQCLQVLSDKPLFFLINGYASGYSALAYRNNLYALEQKFGGTSEVGELTIAEEKSGRMLPCGIFARWSV
jgi:23S rRNA (cytosine1962-C5)-methyltransferase